MSFHRHPILQFLQHLVVLSLQCFLFSMGGLSRQVEAPALFWRHDTLLSLAMLLRHESCCVSGLHIHPICSSMCGWYCFLLYIDSSLVILVNPRCTDLVFYSSGYVGSKITTFQHFSQVGCELYATSVIWIADELVEETIKIFVNAPYFATLRDSVEER